MPPDQSARRMIVAVVTSYKPDAGFASRFAHLLSECGAIVVSDNTPGGHAFDLPEGFTVIHNLKNLGLAPALNIGIERARSFGASTVVLFDQDSTPSTEFITRMLQSLAQAQADLGTRCCLGPTHLDDSSTTENSRKRRRSPIDGEAAREEVTCLPTSGMVFPLSELAPDELFSDELFLDLVDFEWCWRLRTRGWRFLRTREVVMLHRLGEGERRFLSMRFYVPAPYRHYFQVRDSLRMVVRAYVPLYSKIRLVGALPLKAIVYPLLLNRGLERLGWMLRGVRDSMQGVRGIGAAAERLSK
jgi:rhamnosyltransferase